MLNKEKLEYLIRSLTVSQLDALRAILASKKNAVSSQEIASGLKFGGTGKSLSSLNPMSTGEQPLLLKLGKLSARAGFIWSFNDDLAKRDEAIKIIEQVFSRLEEAGFVGGGGVKK